MRVLISRCSPIFEASKTVLGCTSAPPSGPHNEALITPFPELVELGRSELIPISTAREMGAHSSGDIFQQDTSDPDHSPAICSPGLFTALFRRLR